MMMMVIVDGELMDVIEMMVDKQADLVVNLEADKVTKEKRKVDQEQDEGSETVAMMMMVILIVDGELMDVIEMMVDKQAVMVMHMEVDKVTKELEEMDQEQDEGLFLCLHSHLHICLLYTSPSPRDRG